MILPFVAAILIAFLIRAFARVILNHIVGIIAVLFILWLIGTYIG